MLEEKNNNQVMNFKIVVTNLHWCERKDYQPVSLDKGQLVKNYSPQEFNFVILIVWVQRD